MNDNYLSSSKLEEDIKVWRHKKRGTLYQELCEGELQIASDIVLKEGDILKVYFGEDGKIWICEKNEFEDGRFIREV